MKKTQRGKALNEPDPLCAMQAIVISLSDFLRLIASYRVMIISATTPTKNVGIIALSY